MFKHSRVTVVCSGDVDRLDKAVLASFTVHFFRKESLHTRGANLTHCKIHRDIEHGHMDSHKYAHFSLCVLAKIQ